MTKEIKHSKLPWRHCKLFPETVLNAEGDYIISNMLDGGGATPSLSDAKFMVKACNSYYQLKEENERLKKALEYYTDADNYLWNQKKSKDNL